MIQAFDLQIHFTVARRVGAGAERWLATGIEWPGCSLGESPADAARQLAEVIRRACNGVAVPDCPGCIKPALRDAPRDMLSIWHGLRAGGSDCAGLLLVRACYNPALTA